MRFVPPRRVSCLSYAAGGVLMIMTPPRFVGASLCAQGRFVPPAIASEYGLQLPEYPGAAQTVRIPGRKKPKE